MTSWFQHRLRRLHPTNLLLFSFLATIAVGTLLLMLPAAAGSGRLAFIDALFTATSAVCVTGLIVVDTGSYFSAFGQGVILFLIQIGGLGIMTISVALFQIIGKKVVFQQRMAMQEVFSAAPRADIYAILRSVIVFTVIIETVGALALFLHWQGAYPAGEAAKLAVFHAVSAFCNAGFSLFTDSLVGFRASGIVNATVGSLIVLGGIGFPVVYEIYRHATGSDKGRVSIQTKAVLAASAALVGLGALVILVSEKTTVASMGIGERLLTAFFQSVTCRTAGFNTIDIASFNTATLLFMMFLMLVGASPGSCGGGIKTTTLVVLGGFSWSRLMRRKCVNLFGKTLPGETVTKSVSVLVFSLATIGVAVFVILFADPEHGARIGGNRQFLSYLFETVSAFATVGLSMGATGVLTPVGKLTIIVLMIIGRVGVPAFTYIIAGAASTKGIQYAEENLMIG
ncbi:MAG TPA: ATPase [Desulfobacteraceae bacterium]|nr:ATPase [Deltaproteobacteria bacterium]HDI58741.1 ATPase [Desulfobacteraceae bacterium]